MKSPVNLLNLKQLIYFHNNNANSFVIVNPTQLYIEIFFYLPQIINIHFNLHINKTYNKKNYFKYLQDANTFICLVCEDFFSAPKTIFSFAFYFIYIQDK